MDGCVHTSDKNVKMWTFVYYIVHSKVNNEYEYLMHARFQIYRLLIRSFHTELEVMTLLLEGSLDY